MREKSESLLCFHVISTFFWLTIMFMSSFIKKIVVVS